MPTARSHTITLLRLDPKQYWGFLLPLLAFGACISFAEPFNIPWSVNSYFGPDWQWMQGLSNKFSVTCWLTITYDFYFIYSYCREELDSDKALYLDFPFAAVIEPIVKRAKVALSIRDIRTWRDFPFDFSKEASKTGKTDQRSCETFWNEPI